MLPLHRFVVIAANILLYISFVYGNNGKEDLTFPPEFLFGVSTSAYQIEGAWNISDKGESTWDRFVHTQPHKIMDGLTGDVASDSYHKYKEDVQLLKTLRVNFYRFSMSWPRILPRGHSNFVSKDGVRYYNGLIDELLKYNITPMVTLHHLDHPQVFEDMGGWTNAIMIDLFGDYARVAFQKFGDRVKMFSTINEPHMICKYAYSDGLLAPGLTGGKYSEYLCAHNMLKAHARAYHIYNNEFRSRQKGHVGISLNVITPVSENVTLADIAFQFQFGMYAHPIFSQTGDYPAVVKQRIAENSKYEGLQRSRLPLFTQEWIDYIKYRTIIRILFYETAKIDYAIGTADYLGVNHYVSLRVEPAGRSNHTVYEGDSGIVESFDERWPATTHPFIRVYPKGILDALCKIKNEYDNPPVYITENGISDNGLMEDNERIEYIHNYMEYTLQAMKTCKCDVRAYTIWSLIDSFEWIWGYTTRFGLFSVDISSSDKKRRPKASAIWFRNVIAYRKLLPIPDKNQVDSIHSRWRLSWLGSR